MIILEQYYIFGHQCSADYCSTHLKLVVFLFHCFQVITVNIGFSYLIKKKESSKKKTRYRPLHSAQFPRKIWQIILIMFDRLHYSSLYVVHKFIQTWHILISVIKCLISKPQFLYLCESENHFFANEDNLLWFHIKGK